MLGCMGLLKMDDAQSSWQGAVRWRLQHHLFMENYACFL